MGNDSDLAELRRFAATVSSETGIDVAVRDDHSIRGDGWSVSPSDGHYVRAYLFGMLGAARQLERRAL